MDQRLIPLLERIAHALERIADGGALGPARPGPAAAAGQPTFCGYACSWQTNDAGFPAYIVDPETGEMAQLREKQGDRWYSVKVGDEEYRQLIRIAAGEKLPPEAQWRPPPAPGEDGPGGAVGPDAPKESLRTAPVRSNSGESGAKPPETPENAPEPPIPASDGQITALHEAGRDQFGDEWPQKGPELVLAFTDGRTRVSRELTEAEASALIAELQADATAGDGENGGSANSTTFRRPAQMPDSTEKPAKMPDLGQTLFDHEDDETLFDRAGAPELAYLQDAGLQAFKQRWPEERRRRIDRITGGRTSIPEELQPDECAALTNECLSVIKRKGRPAYAG